MKPDPSTYIGGYSDWSHLISDKSVTHSYRKNKLSKNKYKQVNKYQQINKQ